MQQRVVLGRDGQVREQRVAVRAAGRAFGFGDCGRVARRGLRPARPPEVVRPKRRGGVGQRLARHAAPTAHVYIQECKIKKRLYTKRVIVCHRL